MDSAGKTWPNDRPLHVKRRVGMLVAGVAAILVVRLLSLAPGIVEAAYTQRFGQWLGRTLAGVSGLALFSVGELVVALLLVWCLLGTAAGIWEILRRKRRVTNLVVCGLLRLGAGVGMIVFLFYVTWGFNYDRAVLITRMKWDAFDQPPSPQAEDELARLCEETVRVTNREYERAHGCTDLGRPSAPLLSMGDLDKAIDMAYPHVTARLGLHPSFAASRGRVKPVCASAVMSRFLILGTYFPWTGEANYNRETPGCALPEVLAHEKAHQRGITSEDEANFFGFLVCAHCADPYARYSGYLLAQRQLLQELLKLNRARANALIKQRDPGVQRDVDAINRFHQAHLGRVSKVGSAINDTYLKANRVRGGVKSYQMSARLILVFARANGGTCVVRK
jgi:hypothetical protein